MTDQEELIIAFQLGELNVAGNTDVIKYLSAMGAEIITTVLSVAACLAEEKNGPEARKIVIGMGALALNEIGRRELNRKVTFS